MTPRLSLAELIDWRTYTQLPHTVLASDSFEREHPEIPRSSPGTAAWLLGPSLRGHIASLSTSFMDQHSHKFIQIEEEWILTSSLKSFGSTS